MGGGAWPWLASASACLLVLFQKILQKRNNQKLIEKIAELEAELIRAMRERQAERTGRIRAQQKIRMHFSTTKNSLPTDAYPMTPIGILRSCFSTRNGTPRQPLLVPLARSRLELPVKGVPPAALEGLADYSHCWVLYIFNVNTDISRLWSDSNHQDFKSKVRVPRLDGARMGIFATRSPHRPVPIGLSVAKVESIKGRSVYLSGLDVVDGTPVLDIKPYIPYCDRVDGASVPLWAQVGRPDDPLELTAVEFGPMFEGALQKCWEKMGGRSLYGSAQEVKELVAQVLSRDIRSVCQRRRPHAGRVSSLHQEDESCLEEVGESPQSNEVFGGEQADCRQATPSGGSGVEEETPALDIRSNPVTSSQKNLVNELPDGRDLPMEGSVHDQFSSKPLTSALDRVEANEGQDTQVCYHLVLEGIDISYKLESKVVLVESAHLCIRES